MLLILQYDGGAFAGWQRQKADRTVQADLERALEHLVGQRTPVMGAGRTDAGVHALGQAAAAAIPSKWRATDLVRALNALLPADMHVADACRMRPGFNPRRHATERTYCYRIGLDPGARTPFRRRWEWPLSPPFDAARADTTRPAARYPRVSSAAKATAPSKGRAQAAPENHRARARIPP